LMKDIGYGKGYQYAHDDTEALVEQDHLPDEIAGQTFYTPTNRGYEAVVRDRLIKWRKILKERTRTHEQKND
jgi:putative ATPase